MSKSKWSKATIMIPSPRPDLDLSEERKKLKERIKKAGLKATVEEIVEEYYQWKDDPDPVSAAKKKRATLIFSKAELKNLVPSELHKLFGSFDFLINT